MRLKKGATWIKRFIGLGALQMACLLALTALCGNALNAQTNEAKKYSLSLGAGYFSALLDDEGIAYPNATYAPEVGPGLSYFASLDYGLTEDFYVGVGLNGNYARGEFIQNAEVNGSQVDGYLEAGTVSNLAFLLNFTYAPVKSGVQPYAKLGVGYIIQQAELGDVPLSLTNNVEFELFPDYKFAGFGILPEVGIKYNSLSLSAAYGLPFGDLTGEEEEGPDAYPSVGSISSRSLQVNVAYRLSLF